MEAKVRIIFFYFVMVLSAAEEEKKNLTAVVGGNITLDHPGLEEGFLLFNGKNIAMVDEKLKIYEDVYRSRLVWEQTSGLFTISNLQRNNSGVYTVQSVKPPGSSSYLLTVYDRVETPAVDRLKVDSDSCLLLCLVDKETTLLWSKDDQVVNRSSSASSLALTVHKQDLHSSFRCVAVGPAEEKALPVHLDTFCWTGGPQDPPVYWTIILAVGLVVVVLLVTCCVIRRYFQQEKRRRPTEPGPDGAQTEIQYSVIQTFTGRRSNVNGSDPSITRSSVLQGDPYPEPSADRCSSTIYDKLEAHRIIPT